VDALASDLGDSSAVQRHVSERERRAPSWDDRIAEVRACSPPLPVSAASTMTRDMENPQPI
jgi:hypothetical protein